MVELQKKYIVGCLVQWYELEMLGEYVASCLQMLEDIENPEMVTFQFKLGMQEYLERIDRDKILPEDLERKFIDTIYELSPQWCRREGVRTPRVEYRVVRQDKPFYNIAAYRRDLNYESCQEYDYVLWGETDSLWPKQTLRIIEEVDRQTTTPKFILNFAGRKNWDQSWDLITHPLYRDVKYEDHDEWVLYNEASEKSYMTIHRMNEINNIPDEDIDILVLHQPKADGSCLVISSQLIKSGVNIPHALIHCGEDESFLRMAKLIMGNEFVQFHVNNILRVHNRRHPTKRTYIANEDNPKGFCDHRKGDWWEILEKTSKENLDNLQKQLKFVTINFDPNNNGGYNIIKTN